MSQYVQTKFDHIFEFWKNYKWMLFKDCTFWCPESLTTYITIFIFFYSWHIKLTSWKSSLWWTCGLLVETGWRSAYCGILESHFMWELSRMWVWTWVWLYGQVWRAGPAQAPQIVTAVVGSAVLVSSRAPAADPVPSTAPQPPSATQPPTSTTTSTSIRHSPQQILALILFDWFRSNVQFQPGCCPPRNNSWLLTVWPFSLS